MAWLPLGTVVPADAGLMQRLRAEARGEPVAMTDAQKAALWRYAKTEGWDLPALQTAVGGVPGRAVGDVSQLTAGEAARLLLLWTPTVSAAPA